MTTLRTVRVAAVQATPVVLDAAGTVNKAVELIGDATSRGAELVVFTASQKPCSAVPVAVPSRRAQVRDWAREPSLYG